MKEEEIPQVMDIYKEAGWHTGHDSVKKWCKLDSNGFKVAVTDDGEVIGVCGAVRLYDDLHYFGFYVVRKIYRGKDIGLKIWNACKEHIGNRNVGANSVKEKISLYQTKEKFLVQEEKLLIQENDTLEDIITPDKLIDAVPEDIILETYKEAHLPSMYQYDFKVCGFNRELLLKLNCEEKETKTIVALKNEECVGFGTIKRGCQGIPLVSPLYADDPNVAEAMLKQLMLSYPMKKGFYMATLFHNKEANDMIKKIGCPATNKLTSLYKRKVSVTFSPQKVYGVFDIDLSPL
ncbi:uncharacterized protein [Parasteatoda tepidariorum]|nr:uncharacterized protein LOC107454593 isoform X2 [Parasteatoda tepidariorum]XP_042898200.1 uncharacterized protein LOC107454593 isoform X2 [Parasteatoda tepidariorum]